MKTSHHARTKGQAAIEYLITYGWAVVLILVIIGVIMYFGIITPKKFVQDSCNFGEQIVCLDAQMNSAGYVIFYLQNNMGDTIILDHIEAVELATQPPIDGPLTIKNGMKNFFVMSLVNALPAEEKVDINFRLFFKRDVDPSYFDPTETYPTYNITGRIITTVCKGDYVPPDLINNIGPHFDSC